MKVFINQVDKFICFGKIASSHGIKGEVALDCYFSNYQFFLEKNRFFILEDGKYVNLNLKLNGKKKDLLIVKIPEVEKIEDAAKFLKKEVFVERDLFNLLDDGNNETHFVQDLIGLKVILENKEIGKVQDVVNFGSGPLLEVLISVDNKTTEYYEKNKNNIKEVDILNGTITLNNKL